MPFDLYGVYFVFFFASVLQTAGATRTTIPRSENLPAVFCVLNFTNDHESVLFCNKTNCKRRIEALERSFGKETTESKVLFLHVAWKEALELCLSSTS